MSTALLKRPSPHFASGLTSQRGGWADYALACAQHVAYQAALEELGFETILLGTDELADSCFVEDMAVVVEGCAGGCVIATRSPLRHGEQAPVLSALRQALPDSRQLRIEAPGTLEGGDVLRIGRHCLVGVSERTNRAGVDQLRNFLEPLGYQVSAVEVKGVLHLKTGVTRLDDRTVLALPQLAASFQPDYEVVVVDPEDAHAVNVVAVGRKVLLPAGFPRVVQALVDRGFTTLEVDLSEFKKQDGGATCLSLLF